MKQVVTLLVVALAVVCLAAVASKANKPTHFHEDYPFEIINSDGTIRPMTVEDIEDSPDGTILNLNLKLGGNFVSIIKLSNARELKRQKLEEMLSPEYSYDINVPNDFMNNRYPNQFAAGFLNHLNSQEQTYQGYTLNFTETEILGFPPTPIPQTGHVTHVSKASVVKKKKTRFYSFVSL